MGAVRSKRSAIWAILVLFSFWCLNSRWVVTYLSGRKVPSVSRAAVRDTGCFESSEKGV